MAEARSRSIVNEGCVSRVAPGKLRDVSARHLETAWVVQDKVAALDSRSDIRNDDDTLYHSSVYGLLFLPWFSELRDRDSRSTDVHRARMKSPCISICRFDGCTGWCVACGRTLPECREWKKAPRPRLMAISKALPARLAKLRTRSVRVTEEEA